MQEFKKTVVLHVGPPKTGSTSLQFLLNKNQGLLESQGILYPCSGRPGKGDVYRVNLPTGVSRVRGPVPAHHLLAWTLSNRVEDISAYQLWKDLRDEIDVSPASTAVLTSEGFSSLSESEVSQISNYLKKYNVKIIVYQRDPVELALSLYSQNVKMGRVSCGFAEFVRDPSRSSHSVAKVVSIWAHYFPKESFEVKRFDVLNKNDHLERDFLNSIGVDFDIIENAVLVQSRKNTSPSPSILRVLRLVNSTEKSLGNRKYFRSIFKLIRRGIQFPLFNNLLQWSPLGSPLPTEEDLELLVDEFSTERQIEVPE